MNHLLEIIIAAPFVAALVILALPSEQTMNMRIVALLGAGVSLVGSVVVAFQYDMGVGGVQMLNSYPIVPSLGINLTLGVDGWGVSLLLLTGLIIFTGVFASWTLTDRVKEFHVFLLVLVAGVFGVFVSLDLFIFFLFLWNKCIPSC